MHGTDDRIADGALIMMSSMPAEGIRPADGPARSAQLVVRNGRIYTGDASAPAASAVAIRDGLFTAVGEDAAIASQVGPATRVVDALGRRVVPGLNDSHLHVIRPVATGLALVPSIVTVVLTSTLGTRRLLARFTIKRVLLAGLACMGGGQLWLAQVTAGSSYPAAVLPGLVLTALGIDLAILATAAAAGTAASGGSLVAGYRLSFLIATGLAALAAIIVASSSVPSPASKNSPASSRLPAARHPSRPPKHSCARADGTPMPAHAAA
jgi:hypothetical protein